jgi:hypothetical protein
MSPDEARKKYFGLGKVDGGDTPYMQQQMFSLRALAERDADQPFAKAAPAAQADHPQAPPDQGGGPTDAVGEPATKALDFEALAVALLTREASV